MIKPPIEELLENSPGRFALVITSARRAKDINSYFICPKEFTQASFSENESHDSHDIETRDIDSHI